MRMQLWRNLNIVLFRSGFLKKSSCLLPWRRQGLDIVFGVLQRCPGFLGHGHRDAGTHLREQLLICQLLQTRSKTQDFLTPSLQKLHLNLLHLSNVAADPSQSNENYVVNHSTDSQRKKDNCTSVSVSDGISSRLRLRDGFIFSEEGCSPCWKNPGRISQLD